MTFAQGYVTLGTQSTQSGNLASSPVNGYYESRRIQVIYTAAELLGAGGAAGNIERLAWDVSAVYAGAGGLPNYTIKMGHIATASAPSQTYITGLTTVKNPYSYVPALGFNDISLDTPFSWNGTDNVIVDICFSDAPYTSPYGQSWMYTGAADSYRHAQQDGSDICGQAAADETPSSSKPRIKFYMQLQPPCDGTPEGGSTTTALTRNVCSGSAPGIITVTGATPAAISGISLQWEESINGIDWANATGGSGATTTSYTPPSYAGTPIQYRLKVTCANGGEFDYSDITTVGNQIAPATQVSAVAATATGISSLNATWTNGDGGRRLVIVSTSATITDPVNGNGPAPTVSTMFTGTGQQIVYDGTGTSVTVTGLACNTPYYVKVYEYNRCGAGPYDFYYNVTGTPVMVSTPEPESATLPVENDLTGFTGSNLSTVFPGWYEASRVTGDDDVPSMSNPTAGSSTWISGTALGATTLRLNLWDDNRNEWIVSPKMELEANSRLKFKAAITDFTYAGAGTTTADPDGMQGTDDKINVLVSTDGCGASWTVIHTFEASNTTDLENALQDFTLSLEDYTGETVQIAFQGIDGPNNDDPDYEFHIADIIIEETPACDVPVLNATADVTKNSATISWTAPTVGVPTAYEYVVTATEGTPAVDGTETEETEVDLTGLDASTTYYVYVRTLCTDVYSDWTAAGTFATLCDYFDITATDATDICGIGASTLTATATGGTIKWYATETSSEVLAEGGEFTSPEIGESTSYWVTTSVLSDNVSATGKIAPPADATGTNIVNWGVVMNVTEPVELQSVDIYSTTAGTINIKIMNAAMTTELYSTGDVAIAAGGTTTPNVVPLNYSLAPGTGYRMVVKAFNGVTLIRDSASMSFPYGTGAVVVTSSEWGGTYTGTYYYFYNIQYQGQCSAPRTEVAVTVTDAPDIEVSATETTLCNGESTDLSVESENEDYTYVWMPGELEGATHTVSPTETTVYTVTATDETTGCVEVAEVTVTVNALPAEVTISPSEADVCEGGTQVLEVEGATASGDAVLGTGTSSPSSTSHPNPFNAWYGGHKTQMMFKATELEAQGLVAGSTINSLSFDFEASVASALNDLKIRIGSTENTDMAGGFVPVNTLSTYYNASFTPTAGTTGLVEFNLTTPYVWDGSDIIVEVIHNQGNSGNGAGTRIRTTTTDYVSVYYHTRDGMTPAGVDTYDAIAAAGTLAAGTHAIGSSSNRPNVVFNYSLENEVIWSPTIELYMDEEATIPYDGEDTAIVYVKPTAETTYTATVTNAAGCSITETVDVTVNVIPAPAAEAEQAFCAGATVADLAVTDAEAVTHWYYSAVGGSEIAETTTLLDGTPYFVSQTVDGCESVARTMVMVTVNTVDAPTIEEDVVTFCNAATLADIEMDGEGILWYNSATGGDALEADTEIAEGISIFFASQTVEGCESMMRTAVVTELNVTVAPDANEAQTFCNAATVADLMAEGEMVMWYDAEDNMLTAETALTNGGVYYASQTINGCESSEMAMVTVTINTPAAPTGDADQEVCEGSTLADLTLDNEMLTWYTAAEGGDMLDGETALENGVVYYASQWIDGCESIGRYGVTATMITVTVDTPADVTECDSYILPALTNGAYYTETNGGGETVAAGTEIMQNTTLYVYAAGGTEAACSAEHMFTITINSAAAPAGEANQSVGVNPGEEATIADLVVTTEGEGTVTWYASEEDAANGTNALSMDTVITDGSTYYATFTSGDCTSGTFGVTVDVVLGNKGFDMAAFTYHPNPVKNVLNIAYSSEITSVTVFNLLGQQVIAQQPNATEVKIDMSGLADGTYVINVTSGDAVNTFKVIKHNN